MIKKISGAVVACSVLAASVATAGAAQDVEGIMRARERLELTTDQIQRLDGIRRETVARRASEAAEMQEMRSQLAAGQIRQSQMMAFMEERQDARQGVVDQRREQIESILTEGQLETVQDMRRRAGRVGMGVRPGGRPGMDGPGFAPRGRAGLRGPQRPRRGPPRAAMPDFRRGAARG
jgi:hypothetical protein